MAARVGVSAPAESGPKRLTCEHPRLIAVGDAAVQRDRHAPSLALPLAAYKPFAPTPGEQYAE
jgi:hypothetical protein